ncbi:serine carboxypeptidase-like [Prunus yedoensis var. nudiflora]|uniref:Serine carboxypeptidase-like n=1 Tax=Prunus yedoensis var. nudiflora TaxID=2094558 RepID=A0A314Z1D7_PRUYE|nr:serine carboxypeptidase-like [Prunus yedoensis var. nudiflora]
MPSASSGDELGSTDRPTSSFPSVHAKELIKAFNLFPKEDINIIDSPDSSIFHDSPRLVEKRFNLPNLVGFGVSLEDLGHWPATLRSSILMPPGIVACLEMLQAS